MYLSPTLLKRFDDLLDFVYVSSEKGNVYFSNIPTAQPPVFFCFNPVFSLLEVIIKLFLHLESKLLRLAEKHNFREATNILLWKQTRQFFLKAQIKVHQPNKEKPVSHF